jgi:type II secretory pathway pseudopilin PulG
MRRSVRSKIGGFTMIEAMVAMTVLAVGLLGNFMALVQASKLSREGQLRQYKTMLVDTKMQRLLLADKIRLPTMVGGLQTISDTLYPPSVAIGGAPWVIDPSTPDSAVPGPGDLGKGAVFSLSPNGDVHPLTGTFTSCADPAIPAGAYCREVLLHNRLPLATAGNATVQANLDAAGAQSSTLWIRISRKGDSFGFAVFERKVLVL